VPFALHVATTLPLQPFAPGVQIWVAQAATDPFAAQCVPVKQVD
jgi:hypothetical protein